MIHESPAALPACGAVGDDAPARATEYRPPVLRDGDVTVESIARFRREVFGAVAGVEQLREWVDSPAARGLERGMALWALGRHRESNAMLEPELADHPALAVCVSQNYTAAGRFDEALAVLGSVEEHPDRAGTRLELAEARGDAGELDEMLERHRGALSRADEKYYSGRLQELRRDPEAAIALYDETLALDATHRSALFRLALNVDLRGEDEEARELYERALMCPPVNSACVLNLGILYEDLGNYRRAMNCFDLVVQAHPENARARLYRRDAASSLTMYYDEEQDTRSSRQAKVLRTPIDDFELSVRVSSCLRKMNVRTLGDLVSKSEAEMLSWPNFGETSLAEIKEVLHHQGLHLHRVGVEPSAAAAETAGGPPSQEPAGDPDPDSPDPAQRPVQQLDLSIRSRRIIDVFGLRTIGDLASKTAGELLACPNFGQTSLNEVRRQLNELGLSLRGS